jgi:uncharacterized membrane protein YjgN (DUF898 family)
MAAFMGFFVMSMTKNYSYGAPPKVTPFFGFFFLLFPLFFVAMLFMYFFLIRFCIEGIRYKDKALQFSGTPMAFLGRIVLGIILTIVTLGIYLAWFIRDIVRFFVNNTSYDSAQFKFRGSGLKLLGIIIVTLLVPMIIFFAFAFKLILLMATGNYLYRMLFNTLEVLIFSPYIYFVYQWNVDVEYKQYVINWRTEGWPSILKIAQENLLMMITFYIYFPLAYIRLYGYFMNRTVADSGTRVLQFGFDSTDMDDFVLIWKETLLTIVTLGVYFPWAICNINKRILGKTYLESFEEQGSVEVEPSPELLNPQGV